MVYLEFTGKNSTGINVAGVGLDAFVVAEDLSSGGRRHGGQEKRVADPVSCDLRLQGRPVVQVGRSHVPHVILKNHQSSLHTAFSSKRLKDEIQRY
jgi:hypothetical protein